MTSLSDLREREKRAEIARAIVQRTGRHSFAYTYAGAESVVLRVLDELAALLTALEGRDNG